MTLRFFIDFEWRRDPAGYELRVSGAPLSIAASHGEGSTILSASPRINLALSRPQRIVRRGGTLQSYRPLDTFGSRLPRLFADAATPEAVLKFVERFGPLTRDGFDQNRGDEVATVIAHAKQMRKLLDAYTRGSREELAETLGPKGEPLGQSALSTVEVRLVFDPAAEMPQLQFTAKNLLDAMWLQLGQDLTSGAALRKCQHCNAPFQVGPGTGRRADAKFCSDAHRVAFNSLKRAKEMLDA
jgi:hypothetical protein